MHLPAFALRNAGMIALAIRLAALVPILAGGAGAILGASALGEFAAPATASHFRYLSGLLLGVGLLAWWCAADLPRRTSVFGALCAMVTLGGVARLAGLAIDPLPPWPHVAALAMELGVAPALWMVVRRGVVQPGSAQGS